MDKIRLEEPKYLCSAGAISAAKSVSAEHNTCCSSPPPFLSASPLSSFSPPPFLSASLFPHSHLLISFPFPPFLILTPLPPPSLQCAWPSLCSFVRSSFVTPPHRTQLAGDAVEEALKKIHQISKRAALPCTGVTSIVEQDEDVTHHEDGSATVHCHLIVQAAVA